jgi:hypothetical protein
MKLERKTFKKNIIQKTSANLGLGAPSRHLRISVKGVQDLVPFIHEVQIRVYHTSIGGLADDSCSLFTPPGHLKICS